MMSRAIAFLVVLFVLGWSECGSVHAQGCRFLLDNCGGQPSQSNPNQNTQPARPNLSACPVGTIFRRETGTCVSPQNYGGVIPCSEDDKRFVQGRGWVSNCR
jgi:hypothetical protein